MKHDKSLTVHYVCTMEDKYGNKIKTYWDNDKNIYFDYQDFRNVCVLTDDKKPIQANSYGRMVKLITHDRLADKAQIQIKRERKLKNNG